MGASHVVVRCMEGMQISEIGVSDYRLLRVNSLNYSEMAVSLNDRRGPVWYIYVHLCINKPDMVPVWLSRDL